MFKLGDKLIEKLFFKSVNIFNNTNIPFILTLPEDKWLYAKIFNSYFFLNKETRSALIVERFNGLYNSDLLHEEYKNAVNFQTTHNFNLFVICKLFEEKNYLQYEWALVENTTKYLFSYSMSNKLSEEEKNKQYTEVTQIILSLERKF